MWAEPLIPGDTPTLPDRMRQTAYYGYQYGYQAPYAPYQPAAYGYQAYQAYQAPQPPAPTASQPVLPYYVPAGAPLPPPYAGRYRPATALERAGNKVAQVLAWVGEIITALLILRVILLFLAASSLAPFAQIVTACSTPLVLPFAGLFPPIPIFQGQVDLGAVVAIITYALALRILASLIRLLTRW